MFSLVMGYFRELEFTDPIYYPLEPLRATLVAQLVKNLPTMQEPWVRSLGWEDPLEKGMVTQSSIMAWRILWPI